MPPQYLILRQTVGQPAEVVFYDSEKQTRDVKFSGGRWAARRFLRTFRLQVGWENVTAFCEKVGRNGRVGSVVEIPFNYEKRN